MIQVTITLNDGTTQELRFDSMDVALSYAEAHHGEFTGFSAQTDRREG